MAKKPPKVRIQFSITPELMKVFDELSDLTGAARSSFPAELLESNLPMFRELVKVMKIAHSRPAEASESLADMLTATLLTAGQLRMDLENDRAKKKSKALRKKRS